MDDPAGSTNVCPVTGLPVRSKPEWVYEGKKGGFSVRASVIGDRILHTVAKGHVSREDQKHSICLQDTVARTVIGENESFVQIQDWKEFTGADNDARQQYIDYLKENNEKILGVFFCNTSFMFKMSIKLGRRLNMVPFRLQIADDYPQAVKAAQLLLEKWEESEAKEDFLNQEIFFSTLSEDTNSDQGVCKITGLTTTQKPEWENIELDTGYSCSIRLIGDRIVNISLFGNFTAGGTQKLVKIHQAFLTEMNLLEKQYVEIRECSGIKGIPPKKSRSYFSQFISDESRKENGLIGIWFYNVPKLLSNMFSVGLKFKDTRIPVKVVNTYKDSITEAISVLKQHSINIDVLDFANQRFSKKDWIYKGNGYSVKFEVIGDDIIYSEPQGVLKDDDVDALFTLYRQVITEGGFDKGRHYYRILNWENFERTSWRARRKYIKHIKEINKLYPSSLSVVYGMNKFMSLMINMSKAFFPFETLVARDIHHALELIEREQAFIKNKTERKDQEQDQQFHIKIDTYKQQILKYMGSLDWDQKGMAEQEIDSSHPLKEIFDAVSVIKADLDSVFEERNYAENKLRQNEEKYRNILENIDDGYYEVDLEGNLLFFNETLTNLLGYSKEEFHTMNYRQIMDEKTAKIVFSAFKKVYETGQPITDLGYELISKSGGRLYGETSISLKYDMEANITGFRGVVRDRTEKKALEDELIKHRDSLEKMIRLRTKELEEETIQKEYAKKVNTSIFNISAAVTASQSLDELYPLIHKYLSDIVEMPNFYIGLYDPDKDMVVVPYNTNFQDGQFEKIKEISKIKSLTSEVILNRQALLLREKELVERFNRNSVLGHLPKNWLGVPLISQGRTIGIIATQSYEESDYFSDQDMEVLVSVSNQVALAIERQQALDELHEREEKYRKLIKTTSAGYWQVDENDFTVEINQALCDMIGYEEKEIIGRPPFDFFENKSKKDYQKIIKRSVETKNRSYEVTFIKKDSQLLYAKVDARSLFDDQGKFRGSFAFITDITERIETQQELSEAKEAAEEASETTKTIMENLQAGVVLINWDTHVIELVNKAAAEMFGSSPEKIVGNICYNFLCPKHEGHCPVTDLKIQADHPEKYMLNIHKEKIPILKTVNTVVMNGQKYLLESFVDITEQKKAENDLIYETKRANEMAMAAEAASRAKSEFLANMSHEIRTPINGVVGMAEILMDSPLNENQKTFVQTISSEVDSLLGIINTVLDFSKIEAGKLELEEIEFDLRKLFEDLSEVLSIRAEKKGLNFLSFLNTDIPTDLKGDPGRLRQIFMNLVGNALKFTNKGEISVSGTKIEESFKRVRIRFEVKDTGIGIPKEKQDQIFESFSQADGSTTRKYGGTGLGTTISKQLVELMNGEIGLKSEENEGSTFWFTIDVKKQEARNLSEREHDIDLNGLTVLIVDENEMHQFILSKYLKTYGCDTVTARRSEDVMKILDGQDANQEIHLILTDFYFSETNGFEVAQNIRKSKAYDDIPIVLLTSVGAVGDGRRCRDIGIQGYLPRPVRKEDLGMTIASVLGVIREHPKTENALITKHTLKESQKKDFQILVAEDYPTNQQIAVKHLSNAGFKVVLAENGAQAVSLFKTKQVDLILMDIQMPEMDGYEATQQIRQIEKQVSEDLKANLRTPVIALTAHAMSGYREKCIRSDMDDYLTKPLKKKELISMVEKWIQTGSSLLDSSVQADTRKEKHGEKSTNIPVSGLPMDMDKAVKEFDNDEEFLNNVIADFIGEVEKQIDLIETAAADKDFETIEGQSHAIKGGAANLTAMELSTAALHLEIAGKNQDMNAITDAVDFLKTAYKEVCGFLKELKKI